MLYLKVKWSAKLRDEDVEYALKSPTKIMMQWKNSSNDRVDDEDKKEMNLNNGNSEDSPLMLFDPKQSE